MVFMSHWRSDKAGKFDTLDLSLVVYGPNGELLFICDWTQRGDLEKVGARHGGDAWMQRPDAQNINECIAVNVSKMRRHCKNDLEKELRGFAVVCIDWSGRGWDKLPEVFL